MPTAAQRALRSAARVAARADVGAATSAQITGGEPPTQTEYNQLQADYAALRTAFNDLLGKMRTAGILAPDA
jgi:hypothetical protein